MEADYTMKRSKDPDMIEVWYSWKDKRYLATVIHSDLVPSDVMIEINAVGEADIELKVMEQS